MSALVGFVGLPLWTSPHVDHRTDGYPLCSLSVHIKVLGSPRLCMFLVSPEFYFWHQDSIACGVSPSLGLVALSLKWEQHSICLTSHPQRGDAYSGKGPPFEGINQNSESGEEAGRTPLTKCAHFSYTTGD